MGDGTSKPIEAVETGDLLVATDPETGETAVEPVTDLIVGDGVKQLVAVGTDADLDGETDWITATAGHPFWVEGEGWTEAGALDVGDLLAGLGGELIHVTQLDRYTRVAVVHNLTVNRIHTYYVVAGDADPVLVHNDGGRVPSSVTAHIGSRSIRTTTVPLTATSVDRG